MSAGLLIQGFFHGGDQPRDGSERQEHSGVRGQVGRSAVVIDGDFFDDVAFVNPQACGFRAEDDGGKRRSEISELDLDGLADQVRCVHQVGANPESEPGSQFKAVASA
jgi:hypothetical protein